MAEKKRETYKDEELFEIVADVQSGNVESFSLLKARYAPLVRGLVRSFEGAPAEEYEKEAESALLKAAVSFDVEQGEVAFGLYAKICIRNALISLRRKEMSRKRRNERKAAEPRNRRYIGFQGAEVADAAETEKLIESINQVLSAYEKRVFHEYMSDKTVEEIAIAVGKPKKSVNNAIYRIKEKVKALDFPDR